MDETNLTERRWQEFLHQTGRSPALRYLDCFHFDLNERSANELLELVLSGKKSATASSQSGLISDLGRLPQVGDLSIVTNWAGAPRCVIETTAVQVLPFHEMTYDICKREGEDDCLESWQRGHTRFFTEEGALLGYEFTPDMSVVFEDFAVVYRWDEE